ncbi:AAA family ATPase [Ktedonospora formicarum]|uniref:ATP-binding protein n=1 Tax=Ktedonospora formicarum TaxID=2778364 RepID=A0A8J3HT24_9CHLR|nr:ATP-binding protein [Ktedonospora formicarum]GHO43457.1 hypothetical protein KSX_16200 [Ktedonospora formicarum]
MGTLYLMCGTPFSGKTTLAKQIAARMGYHYISLDDLMRERGFDLSQTQPVEEWEKTHHICFQLLHTLMQEDTNIVLDDTNFLKWLRERFRAVALEHKYQVRTIHLAIPVTELERRRQQALATGERNYLDDEAFYNVIHHFEVPDQAEDPIIFDMTSELSKWLDTHFPMTSPLA